MDVTYTTGEQRHLRGALRPLDLVAGHAVFTPSIPTAHRIVLCSGNMGFAEDSSPLSPYLVSQRYRSIVKVEDSNDLIQKLFAANVRELHSTAQDLEKGKPEDGHFPLL